ncbi:ribose transport system substrate-binding protein [Caldanaerobacter subterraneus subsp. tengcongensis MB4]|uniref:Periplasmic sugar-binding proteins n=1 Tax=Caldanaerobacter subterraneus subsp. tengcongensis (strain DSM 15242 / JCM 11007 / NBRC 100824 / MB4) TaxID=273068 RepID=Q8RBP9_CALS4|nr:ABC transporter substrate-binding protein [Caldanaerobacter subterraneus]AAM24024.1 Periplasmic sugar-binding proteins [Caldanaerobacter subterraneus subsp. tengcongensis MB4]MCS3916456.1 ribose transport system substrate-binding protein [Caldanaerobacter subterraneus subsp. tengcongensis MB4]
MKRSSIFLTILVLVLAISLVFSGCSSKQQTPSSSSTQESSQTASSEKKYNIVLITMDSMDEHWLAVKAGAEAKAKELGNVQLTFRAPAEKADPNEQVRMMEDAINQKADAILIAPTDQTALTPVVEKAFDAGIPVILIDSPVKTDKYVSFVATDNIKAAEMAADKLGELLGGKGKIAIISAQPGSGTTIMRENGFKDRLKEKYPDIQIITTQYSMGDKNRALNQALDILTAHPDLAGFYGTNEGSTIGIAMAIKQKDLAGKVKVVGFDISQATINAIKENYIQASMVQNPYMMGYKGVEIAVDKLQGKEVPKRVDTGVTVMTKDNVDEVVKEYYKGQSK